MLFFTRFSKISFFALIYYSKANLPDDNLSLHVFNTLQTVQLSAGQALSMFAYSNTAQQYAIKQAGGLSYSVFRKLFNHDDPLFKCHASFQVVFEIFNFNYFKKFNDIFDKYDKYDIFYIIVVNTIIDISISF